MQDISNIETTKHIKARLFKVFIDDVINPKIIITYKVDASNHHIIEKEQVWFWQNEDGSKRFKGEYPLVFIRKDLQDDMETLDIANKFLMTIKGEIQITGLKNGVTHEKHLIKLHHELASYSKKIWNNYKIIVPSDIHANLILKKPSKDYILYDENMIKDLAIKLQTSITRKLQGERLK